MSSRFSFSWNWAYGAMFYSQALREEEKCELGTFHLECAGQASSGECGPCWRSGEESQFFSGEGGREPGESARGLFLASLMMLRGHVVLT